MSIIPANENLHCFAPCDKMKVESGQCGCHNRVMNQSFDLEGDLCKAVEKELDKRMAKDKEAVRILGDQIGYGYMMSLTSVLWKESLERKDYPIDGALVPASKYDVEESKKYDALQKEAKKMDRELDIVHECLTELYDYEIVLPIIKKYLDRIDTVIHGRKKES